MRRLHELFLEQAARTPDAVALAARGERLTYAGLAERAGSLAAWLQGLGVGPEVRVAVCLERSADLIAALLGILQAGGAYVPLDPAYPGERLAYLLEDCGAEVLLTSSQLLPHLPATAVRTVVLDLTPRPPLPSPPHRPGEGAPPPSPDNLAYVLYTSGSTGLPKGVALTHRNAVAFIEWAGGVFEDGELAGVLAATSISFDLSVFEIFLPLSRGGTVIVAENALAFATLPEAGEVTLINTVPSLLGELLRVGALPPSVKTVNLAGEPLRRSLVDRIEAAGTVERIYNLYGPTESTTYATWTLVPQGTREEPTLGRPIRGTRVVLLDGEIFLGGAGLARGYLDRPDLTAERFLPDPSSPLPGERLYRTGDLGRLLPSGDLEYLGRADHQIKVQGLRIEPGEIESAILEFPGIHAALAVQREDAGARRLIAYLAGAVPVEALRAFLRRRLPGPLVPAVFVVLDAFPLTPNGKIDRNALPVPAAAAAGSAAPRTPIEELLTRAWAEELGVAGAGADDDFFALGGHSLTAFRVLARLRAATGVDLHVRVLFEAPTPAALAARVERELAGATARPQPPPVTPVERTGDLPLSFAQESLWLLDQIVPGGVYNIPLALRLRGPLDAAAWERGLNEVRRRHEALRTTFHASAGGSGGPVQTVEPFAPLPLPGIDLAALPEAVREAEAMRLAAAAAARPFDLRTGPLLRASLLRLGAGDHLALLVCHHIAADGWSIGVLLAEMEALYAAFAAGLPSPLPPLPVQYPDYAAWQRRWLDAEALAAPLAWWRQTLAGDPPLDLPTDRPRPAVRSYAGAAVPVDVPAELVRSLRALARETGSTLFMVLLAAFAALLHRLTGREDVRLGTPVAHRVRPEVAGLIGFFVNTLVLRTDLAGEPRIDDLLARVRATTLGAWAHQEVPFETLVAELRPERRLDQNPLFQVAFGLYSEARRPEWPRVPVHSGTAKLDLYAGMEDDADGGLSGFWELDTDLFDPPAVQRLGSHWLSLLAGFAADRARRAGELELLSAAERHQAIREWNDTAADYPRDAGLWELFRRQAERAPDAVAVIHGEASLTYGELARRSRVLGARLRSRGAGPDVPVALALPRSLDLAVSLLGILEAGGAYVPLDPSSPPDRLGFILRDTGAPVVVTPAELAAIDWNAPAPRPGPPRSGPDNLAYVLYTSGSTGTPKGVAATQRNVARLVLGTGYAQFGPAEVFLQAAPLSFDAATLEIWGPLLHGGRLVLPGAERPSLAELAQEIRGHGVTTLWLTAGLFQQMVEEEIDALAGVRQLLAGGDVVSPAAVRQVLARHPGMVVIDGYGPTEGTTFSCCHPMQDAAEVGAAVPIGRPIANASALVLDPSLRPVPLGVPGELYLGGDGLARGYFGRPDWTAERFVPDPFQPGGRLYRTGDRVRRLPGGSLGFLGRVDRQVKVAGWRVEPAEVEAVLAAHPAVRQVAVAAWDDPTAGRRLVAYAVLGGGAPVGVNSKVGEGLAPSRVGGGFEPQQRSESFEQPEPVSWKTGEREDRAFPPTREGASPSPTSGKNLEATPRSLRAWLRERLPEPMVPSLWVFLDRLPLTANGKVDRAALPPPQAERSGVRTPADGPRTPVAELLAGMWAGLLGVDEVGVHDDFFALGGHSLLATRLLARVRQVLGVDVPLRALFAAPTVNGLAAHIALLSPAPPITHAPPAPTYPVSLGQRRLWFLQRLAPDEVFFNVSHGLRLRGRLHPEALRRSLEAIVARHEPLRTTFETSGGLPVQRIGPPPAVPLPVADVSALPPERREAAARRLALAEAEQPFDLSRGPLFRAMLVRLGAEDHALLLTPHHLVFDGWSMEVLFRELAALYTAFSRGLPPPLPPLPFRFADFSEWQRQVLAGPLRARQLAWWKEALAGLPSLDLPADHPRPAVQRFRGGWRTAAVPAALAADLERLGRHAGATLFMVLLAGFATLLARWSGKTDVPVGSPRADRLRPEVEGLIGFFVNTLVLRVDLEDGLSFSEVVARVRETSLGAWTHQDLPFEVLVEELVPERDLSVNPLFQVAFSLLEAPAATALAGLLPGLGVEPFDYEADVALFDLTLTATRSPAGLELAVSFRRDLFDGVTAERLLEQMTILLSAAAAGPEARAWELPLWSAAAWHQVTREWNDTAVRFPAGVTLIDLIEHQAAQAPGALAVAGEAGRLTYGELDTGANRLARYLPRMGAGRGARVALAIEPSPELALAALAVWKAGATYVPLDPAAPPERLAVMMADAGAAVVLSNERQAGRLAAGLGLPVLRVDADRALWAAEDGTAPERGTGPGDLACIIYTSGSTGVPKGAVLVHSGLLNLAFWHRQTFSLTPADRAALVVNPSFDVCAWEMWPPLSLGASLHALPRELVSSTAETARWMAARGVTLTFLPTPLAEEFLRRELPADLALRALYIGGDRLRYTPPAGPGFRFVNAYGPAETSVVSTSGEVVPDPAAARPPAIGRPMSNAQVFLLDPQLRSVPLGSVGEICVGGRGLAAGYNGRPDVTADRFVANPFAAVPGERLYRTGDLGRHRPDGTLDFVGRADFQVKIRGVRIELGEVEAQLNRHPDLRAAVAAARDDSAAGRRLVAWVVPRPGASPPPTPGALREYLRTKLPEVMVPTAWVVLDALPLTPRGKVDRRALPAPPPAATSREAPQGQTERAVARLWSEVLGIAAVGRDDNFFDLGGHSLALAAIHERLQAELGVRLSLVALFESTTVRALAARLAAPPAPPLTPPDTAGRAERQRGAAGWKERTRLARGAARRDPEEA